MLCSFHCWTFLNTDFLNVAGYSFDVVVDAAVVVCVDTSLVAVAVFLDTSSSSTRHFDSCWSTNPEFIYFQPAENVLAQLKLIQNLFMGELVHKLIFILIWNVWIYPLEPFSHLCLFTVVSLCFAVDKTLWRFYENKFWNYICSTNYLQNCFCSLLHCYWIIIAASHSYIIVSAEVIFAITRMAVFSLSLFSISVSECKEMSMHNGT